MLFQIKQYKFLLPIPFNENERGPLAYIAWYVLSNLKKKSKSKVNDELQIILEHMISSGSENEYIKARSR